MSTLGRAWRLHTEADRQWWLDVARASSSATFFHTPTWERIIVDGLGTGRGVESASMGFETAGGVRAVLPAVSRRLVGPLRSVQSTGEGAYGGLISDGPLTPAERASMYREFLDWRVAYFEFLESPLAPEPPPTELASRFRAREEPAWFIDLDADFEVTFGGFQKRLREHYRSGLRKGVSVREASTLEEYRHHFDAYRDAVDRWGEDDGYGYDWPLFATIFDAAQDDPEAIKLWSIRVGDEVVGGRLVFYWNRHASLWHGSARREYLDHQVMPVADIEIARDAAARGYTAYDLNTTGDHPGVVRYKRRYNSREVPLHYWSYDTRGLRLAAAGSSRVRSVLQRVARRSGARNQAGGVAPIDDLATASSPSPSGGTST